MKFMKLNKSRNKNQAGTTFVLVLVFMGVFLIILGSLIGLAVTQHKLNRKKVAKQLALQISEAGLQYYKWHLAHYPDDLQDGTEEQGPYEHEYYDPQGGALGKFSLEIFGQGQCGITTSVIITSTGWSYEYPEIERIIRVKYARPSVAEFAYLIDDNVWAGEDREIKGRYHSNKGIRMDGENDSLVTSATDEWICTDSFGCDTCPSDCYFQDESCNCPGVFGSGEGQEQGLWQFPPEFPIEEIKFENIAIDLSKMASASKNFGKYFSPLPSSEHPSGQGYHFVFKNTGKFDAYVITELGAVYGYSLEGGHWDYHIIEKETKIMEDQILPSDCQLIFAEDDLWIEGEVKGKITIASADLTNPNTDTDVILNANLTYATQNGSDGILVVGENDILIPLYSPDQMELDGIFLAQKGHFGRNHYSCDWYWPWCDREKLEIKGSIVSKGRVGTKWTYSNGDFASGYRKRENSYDRRLMTSPPPMTPYADNEFGFVKWEEVE